MKFQFSKFIDSIFALGIITTCAAAPVNDLNIGTSPNPAKQIGKRTVGGIYITTDINWSGEKGYKVQPLNTCISLTAPW
ncbi:hypothetical protein TWF481_006052 [Arthrobotrys musiformis]|uniref:Uncharacterized protein n=1 Tax=Arthrobotrys musiformis TaxID=47236 RepID=A0AAV9WFL1_9PEZI